MLFRLFLILVICLCPFKGQSQLTLETIFDSQLLQAKQVSGFHPMNDGISYAKIDIDTSRKTWSMNQYIYKSGKKMGEILHEDQLYVNGKKISMNGYQFSPDELFMLIETETEQIYRHSTKAKYLLWDRKKRTGQFISNEKGSYARFSPDGKYISWVRQNNLYIIDTKNLQEKAITTDGKRNEIINGATDWVYEEEFSMDQAYEWKPDGSQIAWLRFDEKNVPEYSMTMYGKTYPEEARWKYPKPGEPNSKVSVLTYHLENQITTKINANISFKNSEDNLGINFSDTDHYIPRIHWGKYSNRLYIFRMNRRQNHFDILYAFPSSPDVKLLYSEASDTWIDLTDDFIELPNSHFILSSEKTGIRNIHLFDKEGKELKVLIQEKSDIGKILAWDEANSFIYYSSNESAPMDQNIYRIKTDGSARTLLTPGPGFYTMQFSQNYQYRLISYSNINSPPNYYISDSTGKILRNLEMNEKAKKVKDQMKFTPWRFLEVTTSEGINLNAMMLLPNNFDTAQKYPVLMYVYGGPGSQQVVDRWMGARGWWFQYLSQQGYIVLVADNRGTGGRGEAFKKLTYKNLGYYETIDQIEVAKWLKERPFVDSSRIGIFGWSYGGYMASMCISKGSGVFKTAIAVAPVTHWKNYDNIYTERYMQRPIDNPEGYKESSPLLYAHQIKGNYLLIHGTADDNVHFQHSAEMAEKLVSLGIPFDNEFYTNKAHGISGGKTSLHVYGKITRFILSNL